MAALTLPILPIPSQTGAPDLPILPAPPMGGGRNGKQETMTAELFGPAKVPPRIRDRKEAAGLREVLQAMEGTA